MKRWLICIFISLPQPMAFAVFAPHFWSALTFQGLNLLVELERKATSRTDGYSGLKLYILLKHYYWEFTAASRDNSPVYFTLIQDVRFRSLHREIKKIRLTIWMLTLHPICNPAMHTNLTTFLELFKCCTFLEKRTFKNIGWYTLKLFAKSLTTVSEKTSEIHFGMH